MCDFKKLRKQFLCTLPLNQINLKDVLKNISEEEQERLIKVTVNNELVLKQPVAISYQKSFIKEMMNILEKQGSVIDDSVYEAYGRLVALRSENMYFKHYLNDFEDVVSLKENVNLISDGTTGLRTWQAALALSEWSFLNKEYFSGQSVLELGSGIGLTGLSIVSRSNTRKFYFSDCHPSVLSTLCDNATTNLNLNFNYQSKLEENDIFLIKETILNKNDLESVVEVLNVSWEKFDQNICEKIGPLDKVIATDIVYDSDLFEPLFHALRTLQKYCKVKEFLFCCTIRNEVTLNVFLEKLSEENFLVTQSPVPDQKHYVWSNETPIVIIKFAK